jgi:hypothetical protein
MRSICAVLLGTLALSACSDVAKVTADATAQARAHCVSEGKQYLPGKTSVTDNDNFIYDKSVMVTGYCVGPGDPGYVPPAKPAS